MIPLPSVVVEHISLHDKNSYCIGGPARYYCAPRNIDQLRSAVEWARFHNIPFFFMGRGSNILVSDSGWPGLVIHLLLGREETHFRWEANTVTVPGGVLLNRLVKNVVAKGFCGMEELAGIPGTVGGAVVMNAGAFSSCVADTLIDIECYRQDDGKVERVNAGDLGLDYRTSVLKGSGDSVLSARFSFSRNEPGKKIENRRREVLERRRKKQPLDFPNCGSVFRRPPGNYAGTLIEKAGLKGEEYGGARVSEKHANFIINTGDAKADEVRHLIVTIQKRVYERFSVLLEPEVIFMGEFTEPLYRIPQETA